MEQLESYGINVASLAESLQNESRGWVFEIDQENSNRIAGFSMANGHLGELTVLAVLPEFEGRGIGKQLVLAAQEWLLSCHTDELFLYTEHNPNFRAYGFYQGLGWYPTGEIKENGDEKFVFRGESGAE